MRLLCPSGTTNIEKGALGDSGANSVSPNKLDSAHLQIQPTLQNKSPEAYIPQS